MSEKQFITFDAQYEFEQSNLYMENLSFEEIIRLAISSSDILDIIEDKADNDLSKIKVILTGIIYCLEEDILNGKFMPKEA